MTDGRDLQSWIKTCKESWMDARGEERSDHDQEELKHDTEEPKHETEEPEYDMEESNHYQENSDHDHEEPKHDNESYYPKRYLKHHSSDPGPIRDQEDYKHDQESSKHDQESSKHDQESIQQASADSRGIQHTPDSRSPLNISERPVRPRLRIDTNVVPMFIPQRDPVQPRGPPRAARLPAVASGSRRVPRYPELLMPDDGRNTAVYITGLPLGVQYPTLLESLEGLGKIYQTLIIPPESPDGFASAKVIFWDRNGVDRLYAKNGEGRFNFGGNHNPTIAPNRYWNGTQDPSEKSRVVIVTGPPLVVNYPNLDAYFQYRRIYFALQKVEIRQDWNTGMRTMRWCFGSYHHQADVVYESLVEMVRESRRSHNLVDMAWAAIRVSWG